jgi:tRNA modification GTPase
VTTPAAPTPNRASLLTPPGRGAVAVIAAEGAAAATAVDAHFRAANRRRVCDQPPNRIVFGFWSAGADADGKTAARGPSEEMVVCRNAAERMEIHCHGGVAAAERVLGALAAAGCAVVRWTDWLGPRAGDALEAEAETALALAPTRRAAGVLLDQRRGALRRELEAACADLVAGAADGISAAQRRLAALVDRANIGLHLTRPWQVAMAGRPNVGKSSLLNALVGYQRSIVFDQPGTTRDVLGAETAVDGWPVRLTDGAGLRRPEDELEAAGVERAKEQLAKADLVIWVLDATRLADDRDDPVAAARRELESELADGLASPPLIVVNKIDLAAWRGESQDCVATCALSGIGLEALLSAISHRLVPDAPPPGTAVPFTERQWSSLQRAMDFAARRDPQGAFEALQGLVHS